MARKNGNATMRLQASWWEQDVKDKDGNITREGEWVRVRKHATHGIKRAMSASMAEFIEAKDIAISQDGKMPEIQLNLNMKEMMKRSDDTQLLLMIVEWNFTGENGRILPITQEGLDEVHDEDLEYIIQEIDKVNAAPLTEEQRNAFLQMQTSGTDTSIPSETQPLVG